MIMLCEGHRDALGRASSRLSAATHMRLALQKRLLHGSSGVRHIAVSLSQVIVTRKSQQRGDECWNPSKNYYSGRQSSKAQ